MRAAASQYLERYAEPEAKLTRDFGERYDFTLIVPAYAEPPSLLEGYRAALRAAPGKVLVILVVNAPEDAPAEARAASEELWRALADLPGRALGAHARLATAPTHDLLALDRFSPGRALSRRQAVGVARRAGTDLALALWHAGRVACHLFGSTDADVELSADYFAVLARAAASCPPGSLGALLLPFSHVPGGDAAIDRATFEYEAGLRYYVLGLAYAGSPYAHHTIGSTFAVDALSYARVRGFPKRAAGEDFHLLDKLAKVARLERSQSGRVLIRARRSERVPFGTGRRAIEISEGERALVYHPDTFSALRALLAGFSAFAADGDRAHVLRTLRRAFPDLVAATEQALGPELDTVLDQALAHAPLGPPLLRRIHTWFDALGSLKLIHALRDAGRPSLPLARALECAPFLQELPRGLEPSALCRALERLEYAPPASLAKHEPAC